MRIWRVHPIGHSANILFQVNTRQIESTAKPNFDECLIKKHWANYNETLGKHGHSAKYRHMRWACGGHVTAIGCAALPLELCRVFFIDAWQNNVFTECILLALCKIKKIISCPPNFFYSPHTTCGTTC